MLWPIISKAEKESEGKWSLIKIDVDEEELLEVIEQHNVLGVPTLAFYKGAQKIHQKTGFLNQSQFQELQKKYLI